MVQSSQGVRSTKRISNKIHNKQIEKSQKLSTNSNNQTQTTYYRIKRQKKFTYGTNLSANYTLMIVVDSQFGQEVEMSTS